MTSSKCKFIWRFWLKILFVPELSEYTDPYRVFLHLSAYNPIKICLPYSVSLLPYSSVPYNLPGEWRYLFLLPYSSVRYNLPGAMELLIPPTLFLSSLQFARRDGSTYSFHPIPLFLTNCPGDGATWPWHWRIKLRGSRNYPSLQKSGGEGVAFGTKMLTNCQNHAVLKSV